MKRFLPIANLAGVLALVILCVMQWSENRRLHLAGFDAEKTLLETADKLNKAEDMNRGYLADLEEFHGRLKSSQDALDAAELKLKSMTVDRDRVAADRDRLGIENTTLKDAVDKWSAAVTAHDQALSQADAQIQKLARDRQDIVAKYNDLAAQYNAMSGDLKQAGEQLQKLAAERNDVVTKFNDLAQKYNALAKQGAAGTRPD